LECIEKGIDILSDEERLPKLGRVLRAASLDELPELWNIFIGEKDIIKTTKKNLDFLRLSAA